jgi:phosphoglycolate phosphatase
MPLIQCLDRQFPNIQAIIFDKDGTLENSGAYLLDLACKRAQILEDRVPGVGARLLMAFGVHEDTLDPAGLQAVGSRAENEIVAAGYLAATGMGWMMAAKTVREAYIEADRILDSTPASMFPGCFDRIQALTAAGIKLGIVSAASTSQVVQFAEHHQLQTYFQVLLGSDRQFAKPDPRLFIYACQELGVNPDRTLMVGDAAGDMVMASRGGAAGCIGISWAGSQIQLTAADLMITNLAQLQTYSSA